MKFFNFNGSKMVFILLTKIVIFYKKFTKIYILEFSFQKTFIKVYQKQMFKVLELY